MLRPALALTLTLTLASAGACSGTASSRLGARLTSSAGGPVGGALLTVRCPDASQTRDLGRTANDGRLLVVAEPPVPLDCVLEAGQDGYLPASWEVQALCRQASMRTCGQLELSAVLQRKPGAVPPPPPSPAQGGERARQENAAGPREPGAPPQSPQAPQDDGKPR